jgi:endoglucanase
MAENSPPDTRLILSVHAYTPYNFALAPAETAVTGFDDTDPTDTATIDRFMDRLAEKFPDTPIVIGEFGATNRKNPADRERFARYYTKKARSYGFHCIWWDNGSIYRERGEHFGLFDRRKNTVKFPEIVKALVNTNEHD